MDRSQLLRSTLLLPVGTSPYGWQRRRATSTRRLFLWIALLVTFSIALAAGAAAPSRSAAQLAEPLLNPHSVVVAADRPVCSLLGSNKTKVQIVGQDGTFSAAVDGTVYWDFGDTVLANGAMLPNGLAETTDADASNCITLVPKQQAGQAATFLPRVDGELTVWPLGMVPTGPNEVHFYYASVVPDPAMGWRVAGVGLGSFDTETLTAKRALGGKLLWTDGMPQPSHLYADQTYVYLFLGMSRATWTTDTILARVPRDAIESPESYEYWQPGVAGLPGQWIGGLWNARLGAWDPTVSEIGALWRQPGLNNGVGVAYNAFLGRWLAVYSTNFMTTVNARAADQLTGPWDETDSVLVNCPSFQSEPHGFVCYSGNVHDFYTRDGGRTIYVSYANEASYQVYLHEIHLAAPVMQWSNELGGAIYLAGSVQAPAGFHRDGAAFYASDIPVPGLTAIHRWVDAKTGSVRYGAMSPGGAYQDSGIDFYAPVNWAAAQATHALYAPVYRWTKGQAQRYSPFNLAPAGYVRQEFAFFGACPDANHDGLTDCEQSFLGLGAQGCLDTPTPLPSCGLDTDGDGCPDAYELGPDPTRGGHRDPNNFWDFYDVWTLPDPVHQPNLWVRDRVVGIQDVLGVAKRFGTTRDTPYSPQQALADALTPPVSASGYHADFDRGRQLGPYPWSVGPPDGVIGTSDLMVAVRQLFHSCLPRP